MVNRTPVSVAGLADSVLSSIGVVNVKTWGALGDGATNDAVAIQNAADAAFGTVSAPNGSSPWLNRVLYFPPGIYVVTTPISLRFVKGGRIIGAGRFVTHIENTAGGSIFTTDGFSYGRVEGIRFKSSGGGTPTLFNLSWLNVGGGLLEGITFADVQFQDGGIGINISVDNYQGSENLFLNCHWNGQTIAGLKTSAYNALQQTIVGGNFQSCAIGVWDVSGSVNCIEGVGFQGSTTCDVKQDNSSDDTLVMTGCRSESASVLKVANGVHFLMNGISHTSDGGNGDLLNMGTNCIGAVQSCASVAGRVVGTGHCRLAVRQSTFDRADWTSFTGLGANANIEIEDVAHTYGGTPVYLRRQRITSAGTFNYDVTAA